MPPRGRADQGDVRRQADTIFVAPKFSDRASAPIARKAFAGPATATPATPVIATGKPAGKGRRVARFFCGALILWTAGLTLFSLEAPELPGSVQVPLGSLNAIAIGPHGQLYVGSGTYGRVNIYDGAGKFITAVAAPGRPFRMLVNSDGRLYLGYWGLSRSLSVFTADGEPVCKRIMTLEEHEWLFSNPPARHARDGQGNLYELEGLWGVSAGVVSKSGGQSRQIVSQGWGSALCQMPLPALLYGVAGAIALICLRRRRSKEPVPQAAAAAAQRVRWNDDKLIDRRKFNR
jgi:hypothetical protein